MIVNVPTYLCFGHDYPMMQSGCLGIVVMWGCRRHSHPASAERMAKNVGIKLYAWNCKKVIFSNNGADQYPGQNEEGLSVSGEKW